MDSTMQSLNPIVTPVIDALARRKLAAPALLFLAAHRPLAFATGQLLAVAAPFAALLGQSAIGDWAEVLSDPAGPAQLEQLLGSQNEGRPYHD
jgi:hypothetical protein